MDSRFEISGASEVSATVLSLEEAAKLLHMEPSTLRRKAAAGEIPGAKPGRNWLFIESDIISHLRANYKCSIEEERLGIAGSVSAARKLDALLAQRTKRKPKSSSSGSAKTAGGRSS